MTLTTLTSLLSAIKPISPWPTSLISLYLCNKEMCSLITALELLSAEARFSSSERASPEGVVVGKGRPEGSLVWVARLWRCAFRSRRVCSRVALRAWRAARRGFSVVDLDSFEVDVVVWFASWLLIGSRPSDDGGAVVGCDWEDILVMRERPSAVQILDHSCLQEMTCFRCISNDLLG